MHVVKLHVRIELKQKSEDKHELVAVRDAKMGGIFLC